MILVFCLQRFNDSFFHLLQVIFRFRILYTNNFTTTSKRQFGFSVFFLFFLLLFVEFLVFDLTNNSKKTKESNTKKSDAYDVVIKLFMYMYKREYHLKKIRKKRRKI